jgi:hypothetical protein
MRPITKRRGTPFPGIDAYQFLKIAFLFVLALYFIVLLVRSRRRMME